MHNPARSPLSYRTRHELVEQMVPRYKEASLAQKTLLLDAFVAVTGNARNYAIRLLSHATEVKHTLRRPRTPHYGPEVQQVLFLAWTTANQICAKRPIPFLPTLAFSAKSWSSWPLHHESGHLAQKSDPDRNAS